MNPLSPHNYVKHDEKDSGAIKGHDVWPDYPQFYTPPVDGIITNFRYCSLAEMSRNVEFLKELVAEEAEERGIKLPLNNSKPLR